MTAAGWPPAGGGLGYGGLPNSLALELDSFYDDAWDPVSSAGMPDGNHLGLNTNGQLTSLTSAHLPFDLSNGQPKSLWLDIDSVSKALYVYAADGAVPKPTQPMISAQLDVLGLLGTILGIMETFSALSSGGISDPAAVSRGIATALLATAIGIGTALYGLIGHNMLHRAADNLIEGVKSLLLQTTIAP